MKINLFTGFAGGERDQFRTMQVEVERFETVECTRHILFLAKKNLEMYT